MSLQRILNILLLFVLYIHQLIGFMNQQFCYWDVRNLPDAVIITTLLIIVLIIFIITLLRLKKIKKYGEHGRRIARVYTLIVFWSLVLISQFLYGISVYFFVIYDSNPQPKKVDMESYSRTYLRIDIISGFIVQTIFLQICKLYYRGLTNTIQISKLAKWEQKFITVLGSYSILRIVAQSIAILLLNIFAMTQMVEIFLSINIWVLIGDCFITNGILFTSLKIFLRRFGQSGRLQQSDLKRLKSQYSVMICTSGIRIIIDTVFLIIIPQTHLLGSPNCIDTFNALAFRTIVYNGVGNIINHLLPIIWVLKIYNMSNFQDSKYADCDRNDFLTHSILGSQ